MKRQSTTARLSRMVARSILNYCERFNCGVIIRIGGIEWGIKSTDGELLATLVRTATILKATIAQMALDNDLADANLIATIERSLAVA